MQWDFEPDALWAIARGAPEEMPQVEQMLIDWSKNVDAEGCFVFGCENRTVHVLVGIVAALAKQGAYARRMVPGVDAAMLKQAVETLFQKGLIRNYQRDAVYNGLSAPYGRGILDVGMGGGKTRIAATLAVAGAAVGRGNWIYLVQNGELARQSQRSFAELMPKMEQCLGLKAGTSKLVATTYSQVQYIGDKHFDGCIVDECHFLPAPTRALSYARIKACWRIGLSGTPLDRTDGRNSVTLGLLGPIVYHAGVADLEKDGYLTRGVVKPLLFDNSTGKLTEIMHG